MAKAMLIIEMPNSCCDCPCYFESEGYKECEAIVNTIEEDAYNEKPTWCPLREVPSKEHEWHDDFESGWNRCIDEILGGAENE